MPWKTMDVREQRVRFVVAAMRRERPLTALCEEFGYRVPPANLWLNDIANRGSPGLPNAVGVRRTARDKRLRSWRSRWSLCASAILTGERASCKCCWSARA